MAKSICILPESGAKVGENEFAAKLETKCEFHEGPVPCIPSVTSYKSRFLYFHRPSDLVSEFDRDSSSRAHSHVRAYLYRETRVNAVP